MARKRRLLRPSPVAQKAHLLRLVPVSGKSCLLRLTRLARKSHPLRLTRLARKSHSLRLTPLALAALLAGIVTPAQTEPSADGGSTIQRRHGGVVFPLGLVPEYLTTANEEFRLFRWDADEQAWQHAPFQIDERTERGRRWVDHEDGMADADDEFVALVRSLGGRAPETAWPDAADDTLVRYDLEVTDPLDPGAVGWLHLFRSTKQPQVVPTLVRYSAATGELAGTDYRLVQARGFPGLETLELFGSGVDVLDRTKLRARVYAEVAPRLGPIPLPTVVFRAGYTEESPEVIENAPDFELRPVKQGPVRLVLEADGSGFAYPDEVQLFAAFGRLDIPPIPPEVEQYLKRLDLHARVTVDFTAAATTGRYADSNRPAGVAVDGQPESIPERPISDWRQIDTPYGGIVLVVGRPAAMRELRNYYNDSGRDEPPGTGDSKAYGENGVFTEDLRAIDRITDFLGWLVVVPKDSPVVGERISQEVKNPVRVRPIRVVRAVPTTAVATSTPHATATATALPPTATATAVPATATATVAPSPMAIRLPYLERSLWVPSPTPTKCVPQAQPVDVVLAMDTSTSMSEPSGEAGGSKLAGAIAAAQYLASLLKPDDRLGVVSFHGDASVVVPLTTDRERLRQALERLPDSQSTGTRIDLGLRRAVDLLQASVPPRQRAIVLLTDGRQAGGGSTVDVLEAAALAHQLGMALFTIALGPDADVRLLREVASRPEYAYVAPSVDALQGIYGTIAQVIPCP